VDDLRTPPAKEFKAARYFNLAVAGLVFCLMLAFAAWVTLGALTDRPVELLRALAGTVIGSAALVLLTAVHAGWRSGEPFQHDRRAVLGMALFGIGLTILAADLR
jgi:cytochrome c biogenesis protein CcdA